MYFCWKISIKLDFIVILSNLLESKKLFYSLKTLVIYFSHDYGLVYVLVFQVLKMPAKQSL